MSSLKFITLVVLAIGGFALQIDDDLNPAALMWVNEVNSTKNSEAYYYLMGFHANRNESPIDVGKYVYQSIKKGEERYSLKESSFEYVEYPDENKIPLPKGDLFCNIKEDGCLKALIQGASEIKKVLEDHLILLKRYHEFLELNEFKTLTMPIAVEPLPPFQYFSAGHRLNTLSAIAKANNGKPRLAVGRLYDSFVKLRRGLSYQDNLIGKMVILSKLSENLEIISLIAEKYDLEHFDRIMPISKEERDFKRPMMREFGMAYNEFKKIDRHPEFWEIGGDAPGFVVRMVFKPNMSANAIFPGYEKMVYASQLSQKEFVNYVKDKSYYFEPKESLRNYAGSILNRIGGADMINYVASFYDINCKIELLNHFLAAKNEQKVILNSKNPYGISEAPVIHENGNKMCFDGPLPDKKNLRCLTIKI